jgi:hypothetical protein
MLSRTAKRRLSASLLGLLLSTSTAWAAATITIKNIDAAGVGLNDPTPVAPVGGNTGTTLGQQRLNVLAYVAGLWGAELDSTVVITIRATVTPLTCNATSAVLASAGARVIWRDFAGAPRPGSWYGQALANKRFGANLNPDPNEDDIAVNINRNLGSTGCLTGSPFYLGLDNNPPAGQVNLVATLLHEFAHGLGFQTFTSGSTGAQVADFPSGYDFFLFDGTQNKTWDQMTNAERAASAINFRRVAWNGANVVANSPVVLNPGTPVLRVSGPAAGTAAGDYAVGAASFGPALSSTAVSGDIMPIPSLGCAAFTPTEALAVNGNIALIDRGTCSFVIKVKNAQNAGAKAVIIANNVAGSPPPGLGGVDPTITIPAVGIMQADANTIRARLTTRSRTKSGVIGAQLLDLSVRAGADSANRVYMFTPNPFQGGSSVSHYDSGAFPNLLMEPSINVGLTQSVKPPQDLTLPLLKDLGW